MSRRILTFSLFEATKTSGLTEEQEEFLNKCTKGTWKYDPATGLVHVRGNFDCSGQSLSDLQGVKFGKVSGYFWCYSNQLTTLEGAPQEVLEDFSCRINGLTSLEGAPKNVGGDFRCDGNLLTSLKGAPENVGGDFKCGDNQLTTLEGAPKKVGWDFYCHNNKLTSLEGAPEQVGGHFSCERNKLITLEGAPRKVEATFTCKNNQLTTLEGAPEEVGWGFYCQDNPLSSLKGAPGKVGNDFVCDEFDLGKDQWNIEGWIGILEEGSPEDRRLILTILSPEALNKEIQKYPASMAMSLKSVWNDESFRETRAKLVWPKGYEQEADLLGDLDDVGF